MLAALLALLAGFHGTTATASTAASCEQHLYAPADGRLTPHLLGRLSKSDGPTVGFEILDGHPLVAMPHQLIGFTERSVNKMVVTQLITGLSVLPAARVELQTSAGFQTVGKNGTNPDGIMTRAIHGRLYASGTSISVEVRGRQGVLKAAIFTSLTILALIVAATTAAAQTQVFVPGTASGCFGNPVDECVPLVAALTVSGPSWITVTYVSGMVNYGPGEAGPNGVFFTYDTYAQVPLQAAVGVSLMSTKDMGALFGVFVPQKTVQRKAFNALDGTKNVTRLGIMPNRLFFIGTGKRFWVTQAGTLFLGVNDSWVSDNGGGFNVAVAAQ
jgi:hypothetical protein